MNFSEIKRYKIVISLVLVFLIFASSVMILIAVYPPEELQKPRENELQPTTRHNPVPSSTKRLHYNYCIIEEVHPDFLKEIPHFLDPNATIVHLSSDDLKPFPEFQKFMADERVLSKKWRDGHRFIGDFYDFQNQFSDFRNLTCKYNPDPDCNPWKSSQVYEITGRYFTVGCLPDFGGGNPTPSS